MSLITFGINHETAPVALREKVAFSPDTLVDALQSLQELAGVSESVIVSTCNRTELYVAAESLSAEQLCQWLADFQRLDMHAIWDNGYVHQDLGAIEHLMQVASGLNSLILGEPQILGQIKQAYTAAKDSGTVFSQFERLFQQTFAIAKRVRHETEIGANAVSVAFAAVQLAKYIFAPLDKSRVLLVGAGETIELVTKHLVEQGVTDITVANRTVSRAQTLANQFNGTAITLAQLPKHLPDADIIISSTASQLPVIGKGMMEVALKKRRHKPVLLLDIAVPRDIEEQVADLNDAYLYTVDDLQQIVEQNIASRRSAAEDAKTMVAEQAQQYIQWTQAQDSIALLRAYRKHSEQHKTRLKDKALAQLKDGKDPISVIEELANKLTNGLIHGPTTALKQAAERQDQTSLALLQEALGLQRSDD